MDFLPIAVRLTEGSVLLVGNSREASHKAAILSRFTDKVTVVAPSIPADMRRLPFRFIERPFEEGDLEGVRLLFVCTGDREENHRIRAVAARHGVLTSVCDDPAACDFISPAISHREGDNLTIAVGSDAKDVRHSIRVRDRIDRLVSDNTLDIS